MFIDARKTELREIICDICIVGAGPAGITIARSLAKENINICLLESGGFERDQNTQSLYKGEVIGFPYYPLETTRLRYFGGTTGHWGGACWPLEENEFQQREWIQYSGWPFSRKELDPHYIKAQSACELGPFNYDANYWSEEGDQPTLPLVNSRLVTRLYQNSPPTRFGTRYREEIDKADNISAILYANVTKIERDNINQTIRKVTATTLEGKSLPVTARIFVIATGGLENPRLLLLNDIGNQNDLVGRFFMEHIGLPPTTTLLIPKHVSTLFYIRTSIDGTDIRAGLSLRPEVLEKERILNTWIGLRVESTPESRLADSWDIIKSSIRKGELPDKFSKHVRIMYRNMRKIYGDMLHGKDDPDELVAFHLGQQSEQSPNPLSRVTLSDQLDELGQRKMRLDWRLTEFDYRSIRRTQEIAAAEIGKSDLGRMKISTPEETDVWEDPKRISELVFPRGAYHHMGTTRMHKDPKYGVVDENCRVHGIKNLYIAGSSVFPTCGYVNPTLTIVALAYRLADHLRSRVV